MIGRTVGALMPDGRERYLALEPDGEGRWIQIGNTFLDTSDEAGKLCILNLKRQVAELFEHAAMTRRRMLTAIDRLHDRPRTGDIIEYQHRICIVDDDDGTLLIPRRASAPAMRRQLTKLVTGSVYQTLKQALDLDGDHEEPLGLIVDFALETPVEVLSKVQQRVPGELATISLFIVELKRHADKLNELPALKTSDERGGA